LPSYKRPCRYCGKLVLPEDYTCPFCGKESPIYIRCPKCKAETQKEYQKCPSCGQALHVLCVRCGRPTFFDVYCETCGQKQEVECLKCHTIQIPFDSRCVKCRTDLKISIRPA